MINKTNNNHLLSNNVNEINNNTIYCCNANDVLLYYKRVIVATATINYIMYLSKKRYWLLYFKRKRQCY